MSKSTIIAAIGAAAALAPLFVVQSTPLEPLELKTMIENMGYTTKVLNEEKGKEKYQLDLKNSTFNVPVGVEITSSRNYIWFTVFLGAAPKSVDKHTELLKKNYEIQPDFFYITSKGNLMLGVPVDNRGVTPAIIRRVTDKLAEDVAKTADVWQEK